MPPRQFDTDSSGKITFYSFFADLANGSDVSAFFDGPTEDTQLFASNNSAGYSEAHSQRVTAYTISIAKNVPVPLDYLTVLARAAFLHDIGKMAIPDKILRKPRPLDDAEKVIMRIHCEIGYNMLTRIPFLRDAAEIVLAHHEFFDGTGYPRGLRGEQIPRGARIISIANAFDAILSDWPYRNALPSFMGSRKFGTVPALNSTPKLSRSFSPFPRTTGSSCVKVSAHRSASLASGIWVCPAVVPSKSPGTGIKSAIVTMAVSSRSTA